ncbi:SAM-dependent chlorinase/fluorinase [Solirubrobacter phytolaccae]|uniref:SAM-dependent chlorinase/fluorinase n=1 Tax=Solirubrobacter phytolaccae TaxID=1404360 RepID=A0A9X3NGZ1_9ACTN|nr:SAM-dependent chlorinase/fluorinase [Solirubrobacter phytolaccae]MDA0181032.1 SAM-dependent chlorinase/fluorinase [Solirubrobacter phytolaccae]
MFVTFLSDYGPGDEYVGVVEGVIASIAPDVRVIHLGHGVPAQDVRTGARRLARALPFTPAGVHLAVVDPGVGGARRGLAIRCGARWLVGPDNGLLVPAGERFGIDEVVDVSDSPWRLQPVSATFHGRDVFGPVAAHLALGEAPDGPRLDGEALVRLAALPADKVNVVEVDGFGNLITDAALPTGERVRIGGHEVVVGRTFGDVEVGGLVIYEDSAGDIAVAVNGGSAAALLGVGAGDELELA